MIHIETFTFNSFLVNTYVIWDETFESVVIDPAFQALDEQARFDSLVAERKLRITNLINTHCHVDHVLGVNFIKEKYKLPFRAHRDESDLLHNAPLMGDAFGMRVDPISGIDVEIEDGELIKVGNHSLQSLHVPGHSRGSLAYYSPEGGFVVTGDALFAGSIGRTDLPGGNYDRLINSLETRLMTLPPHTIVYPGHGPSTTIGEEKRNNPFFGTAT